MRRERKGKLLKGETDNTGEESAARNTGERVPGEQNRRRRADLRESCAEGERRQFYWHSYRETGCRERTS